MSNYWDMFKDTKFLNCKECTDKDTCTDIENKIKKSCFHNVDSDTCMEAINFYQLMYGDESLEMDKYSGECDFNFKQKNRGGKYNLFNKIIKDDTYLSKEKKEYLEKDLKFCSYMHHSLLNMSLIMKKGGLNNFKGSGQNWDRLDFFVYWLNEYYTNQQEVIFFYCTRQNYPTLKQYLNRFNKGDGLQATCAYCKNRYFIYGDIEYEGTIITSYDYVMRLIDNGKKRILTAADVERYIELAKLFWLFKLKHYQSNVS